jgi:polar amino acid transport system substrate-binding protein
MKRRTALAHLLAGLSMAAALPASAQTLLDDVVRQKTLRVGVPVDLPPFGFLGADQQPQGLDVDMAQLVAAKLGVAVKLVPVSSAQRVPWLQERKVDLVISTLGKNPEREKLIDFTQDYSSFYLAVFGPKNLAAASAADLAGKTIAVTKGSIEDQELTKAAPATAKVERFDDNAATMAAYVQGKTQLLAAGISAAMAAAQKHADLEVDAKFVLKDSRNHIGVPKGEERLRDKVNEIIEAAKASGELRKLSTKWFSRSGLKQ